MAKFFPKTMLMVLNAFTIDKKYSVKDLLEILPEMKYKALEYNLRHYHSNHLLKREKERTIIWNIHKNRRYKDFQILYIFNN
jgi:hypothetical protein